MSRSIHKRISIKIKYKLRSLILLFILLLNINLFQSYAIADKSPKKSVSSFSVKWTQISSDLELGEVTIKNGFLFGVNLTLIRTSLKNFKLRIFSSENSRGLRAQSVCEANGTDVCINANFFDPHGNPLGLVIKDGKILKKQQLAAKLLNGLLYSTENSFGILSKNQSLPHGTINAIQAGPLLLHQGKKQYLFSNKQDESNRAGVCINNQGKLLFFCTNSNLGGLTLPNLQSLLLRDGINCVDALNFDGGGSAQLYANTELDNKSESSTHYHNTANIVSRDAVPVIVGLKRKR